jgi:hypothetical protein
LGHCRYLLVVFTPKITEIGILKDSVTAPNLHSENIFQQNFFDLNSATFHIGNNIFDHSVLISHGLVSGTLENGNVALALAVFAFG